MKSGNMDRQAVDPRSAHYVHGPSVGRFVALLSSLPPFSLVSIPEYFNCRRVRNARFYGGEGGREGGRVLLLLPRLRTGRILFHMGIGSLEVVIIANGGTHVTG